MENTEIDQAIEREVLRRVVQVLHGLADEFAKAVTTQPAPIAAAPVTAAAPVQEDRPAEKKGSDLRPWSQVDAREQKVIKGRWYPTNSYRRKKHQAELTFPEYLREKHGIDAAR